ncbi:serine/threonine protein kinase [Streptomyces canus]|uniref:non-specific serine/threonine protein kinase n=1 Tax=Streptomyces canus TaxID=58343 RepID=A0A101RUZ2_9ACTN|nr:MULTISPECIES: serine/threonine-protein kinase [Streptomyces]KUN62227.1 serine/threonine protein kinase [Streptomyces canus]MDI5910277.1 protein kinase [Streptomyces sp. 12257]
MAGETPEQSEGRTINGRYRLLRTLGAGGMGRVWLAYDEELACEVAMKEIALPDTPMDAGETAQRISRARSEARHAARLRGHPHVATVHDVVVHEGLPWIVMEQVPDAIDLQAVVRRSGPLSPEQAARIGLAVLDALTAGHRVGILHRDVKPANILLAPDASGDPYARVLLTDYGIALQPESREPRLTATAGILGTPGYLAPERARGEPPTPAADLFSLGATLYATVEGRGPFDRHGEFATLTALLGEDPTPPARAGELTPALLGLLVKDPVRRFSPETVKRELDRVLQGARGAGGAAGPGYGFSAGGFGPPPGDWASAPGTPHTPVGAAGDGGPADARPSPGEPATPGVTPGSAPPYSPWPPAAGQALEPGNPYAQGAGSPYAGGGSSSPYGSGGPSSPYGGAGPGSPYGGGASGPYSGGGSSQPYGSGTPAGYGGSGAPGSPTVAGAPTAFGGPVGPGGPGGRAPFSSAPPPPPRPAARKRLALVALVVGVFLVVAGGAWGVMALTGDDGKKDAAPKSSPSTGARSSQGASPTGPVLPYGEVVGLDEPLETGDCVQAVWSGTPFKSAPNLGVVDCADDWPDGQVVAVDAATDFADAKAQGAKRCADLSRAVVDALPDAAGYAVVPTEEGFGAAGSGTACLVLGRHAAIGGEVGRFRDLGTDLWVGQMSVGDCWVYQQLDDGYKAPLTDCSKAHTDQVIGTVQAPAEMTYKKGTDNATKLCGNKFESTWAPDQERLVYGWVADEDDWKKGFNKIVCTVSLTDNKKSSGKIPPPGAV